MCTLFRNGGSSQYRSGGWATHWSIGSTVMASMSQYTCRIWSGITIIRVYVLDAVCSMRHILPTPRTAVYADTISTFPQPCIVFSAVLSVHNMFTRCCHGNRKFCLQPVAVIGHAKQMYIWVWAACVAHYKLMQRGRNTCRNVCIELGWVGMKKYKQRAVLTCYSSGCLHDDCFTFAHFRHENKYLVPLEAPFKCILGLRKATGIGERCKGGGGVN